MSRPVYLGPLTTRAILPTCTSVASSFPYFAQTGYNDQFIPACYPSNYAPDGVYTPGICPYGWTSACSFVAGESYLRTSPVASETGVQCCPEAGYTCAYGAGYCQSGTVYGKPILVLYQSTDSAISRWFKSGGTFTPDAGATTTRMSTVVVTTTAASSGTAFTSSDQSSESSGLSTGAKIGIGVGVPALVIILALCAWIVFLIRSKRKNKGEYHRGQVDEFPSVVSVKPNSMAPSSMAERHYPPSEIPGHSTPMLAYSYPSSNAERQPYSPPQHYTNQQPNRWSEQ